LYNKTVITMTTPYTLHKWTF